MTPALTLLTQAARADFAARLAVPQPPMPQPADARSAAAPLDVLIVGGGQSGIFIAAALKCEGIDRICVLDRGGPGEEGPWLTYARMAELRTPKTQGGVDFGMPSLSLRGFYAARHGQHAWEALARVPRTEWKAYLDWYADVCGINIEHHAEVVDVCREDGIVTAKLRMGGQLVSRQARTIVLATGYEGAGAWRVPDVISQNLSPHLYAHSNGPVPLSQFAGARIGILGHGASAFDNAIAALQAGAASVDVCFRRQSLPRVNPHRFLESPTLMTHFPELADATRWDIARFFRANDQPPPVRSFETALNMRGFRLRPATPWLGVQENNGTIEVSTPSGVLHFDYLIAATGLAVELEARGELASLAPAVARWAHRFQPAAEAQDDRLAALPYLDAGYGFRPLDPRNGWVSRVFAFNGASFVSHGPHSTSISGHRHALPRLVRGVLRQLALDAEPTLLARLAAFRPQDLPVSDDFEAQLVAANAALQPEAGSAHPAMSARPAVAVQSGAD